MRVTYTHICDYAMNAGGKVTVVGMFNMLRAQSVPARHGQFYLVFEFALSRAELDKEHSVLVELRDEDGALLLKADAKMRMNGKPEAGDELFVPQILGFNGVVFPKFGRYKWSIFVHGDLKGEIAFSVVKMLSPGAAKP